MAENVTTLNEIRNRMAAGEQDVILRHSEITEIRYGNLQQDILYQPLKMVDFSFRK